MRDLIEELLNKLGVRFCFGQVLIQKREGAGFILSHCEDASIDQLQTYRAAEDAVEIAKYDDTEKYRPLRTAPNLRHGWRLEVASAEELKRALDYFYPGRLAVFERWKNGYLQTTPMRDTLDRQSGMYRVAAKISDEQINNVVGDFCQSDSGCLRTILWERDRQGGIASTKLPKEKFDPALDQTAVGSTRVRTSRCDVRTAQRTVPLSPSGPLIVPLLCQEACNLLVNECRKAVKGDSA